MKGWIKSYWSNCLSIAAIICSIVAICVSLPSAPELGFDYNGALVGILSFLVTMLIGWQIYNAITIEKKIKDEIEKVNYSFSEELEKMQDYNDNALLKILFKATITEIELYISNDNYNQAIECLKMSLYYSKSINEIDFIRLTAALIAKSKYKIDRIILLNPNDRDIINKAFADYIHEILNYLPASEKIATTLFSILEDINESDNERSKYKAYEEKKRQEQEEIKQK